MKNLRFLFAVLIVSGAALTWGCQSKEVTSAKVYIQQNDWDNAIIQLESSIEAGKGNSEAHYLLGRAYGQKGRIEDMVESFEESMKIDNKFESQITFEKERFWVDNFNKGVNGFNQKDLNSAIEAFETAALISPEKIESYRNLGVAYMQIDPPDPAKAIANYEKAVEAEPDHVETLYNFAIVHYQEKNFTEATEVLEKILELDPGNADAISTLGIAYDQMGQTDKAMEAYKNAIAASPDNTDLQFNYARLFYNKDMFEEAVEKFKAIYEVKPDDYDVILHTGDSYIQLAGKYQSQARDVEDKDSSEYADLMAKAKENYIAAIPFIEKALESQPENASLWFNLGVAHTHAGNADKSKEAFDKHEQLKDK